MSEVRFAAALRAKYNIPGLNNPLAGPLNHVLGNGGALVRPQLAMLAATRCGWDESHALDFAAATELFHTASLVLDDLPCMDDAQRRRGRTCVHREYGEASALLATVFMINRAFTLTHRATEGLGFAARRRAGEFADRELGADGVLLGQALDLLSRTRPGIEVAHVADLKTGSLLRYALMLPVVARGAQVEEQVLDGLTRTWGELYQLCDDMRDVGVFAPDPGKDTGIDARTGSANAVHTAGEPAALTRYRELLDASRSACAALRLEHETWAGLAHIHTLFAAPYEQMVVRHAC